MKTEKLMLIDGNSILNRAFYGLQGRQLMATSDGLYTNAVYGFINILNKYLEEEKPQYLCVAFDMKAPTFRHKEFEAYKAKRKGMPGELAVQMPVIKDVLDAMNIKRLEYEGFEADDILGSVSLCAENKGMEVVIITGDRDSLQLAAQYTRIKIPTTKGGRTETEEYDYSKVIERYGVTPVQFIDVKGLMGDTSDNIPGVPGIGEKTAVELIKKFGSIENIYENLDQVEKKGVKEKLSANKDLAIQSKRLSTIDRNMPELCQIEELKRGEYNREKLYQLFKRLEFRNFIEKFNLSQAELPSPGQEKEERKQIHCIREQNEIMSLKKLIVTAGEFSLFYIIDKVETFENKLIGMAITCSEEQTSYLDISECITEEEFLKEFSEIFENPAIKKYGHELKNFILYLKNKGIRFEGMSFDTTIAAYIINPSRDTYTVSELAQEHLNANLEPIGELIGKGKSFTRFKDMPFERISQVTGEHCAAVFELKKRFEEIIISNNQEELYYKIELPLVEVLADMEYWGFKVNIEELRNFSLELEERINILTSEIYSMAGEEFNINSPKQLGVILFEKLGLPIIKKTKTGYSTDAEVLDELASKHIIINKILEYRQLVKLKSTYVEGLLGVIHPATGKIHSSFNQTVTTTGRISSTEPNLQNIPIRLELGRKIRKVFIPSDEEYMLADADYSQIELRVLAHITGDSNMISAFLNNEDIHTSTASQIFGVPKEDVTPSMRSGAKTVNFGIVYGIGDFSLSKDLGITRKEARQYIDGYLDKYPEVKKYMHDIVEEGKSVGYVTTMFNRRRYLPELQSSNFNIRSFGERIAMNTPIQGSAADIIKIAMVNVYNTLKQNKMKSRLILQVHDELIIETFKEEKTEVTALLKQCMEEAASLKAPLLVEVKTGSNWYETK